MPYTRHVSSMEALFAAVHANDHAAIRGFVAENPNVKATTKYTYYETCSCGCAQRLSDDETTVSRRLLGRDTTLDTCRLLFDLGVTAPPHTACLFDFASGAVKRNLARNFLDMCQWYDAAELAALRRRDGSKDVTLIWMTFESVLGLTFQELRPAYVDWLNVLLRAGCPLRYNDVPVCDDEFSLAVIGLYVDPTTNTVYDAVPELQTDDQLFQMWRRRHLHEGFGLQLAGDTMEQRRAAVRAYLDAFDPDRYAPRRRNPNTRTRHVEPETLCQIRAQNMLRS